MKTLRNLLICSLCSVLLVSTGFGMWYFSGGKLDDSDLQSNTISVDNDMSTEIGTLEFIDPSIDGYMNYGISISSDFNNLDNYGGIAFSPNIKFKFSDYQYIDSDKSVYYYFTFSSTSDFYAESESDIDGYVLFDTNQPGQSEQNKIQLNIRDNENNLIYKTDGSGEPVLDVENNYIYEVFGEFSPVFKYKTGSKPTNTASYKLLLNQLNLITGETKLHLHIVTQ